MAEPLAALTNEARMLFVLGMHNVICHYAEVIHDGPKQGRARRIALPAYGSADCMCQHMRLKYNGEEVELAQTSVEA